MERSSSCSRGERARWAQVASVVALAVLVLPAAVRAEGRLEVVPDAWNGIVQLQVRQALTVEFKLRNSGDAPLLIASIHLAYDNADASTPAPPQVRGWNRVELAPQAVVNSALEFPAYPSPGIYTAKLYVTASSPGALPQPFQALQVRVDEAEGVRLPCCAAGVVAAVVALLLIVATLVWWKVPAPDGSGKKLNFFRTPAGDYSYSTSRFQIWLWTVVVLASYVYLFLSYGPGIYVPSSVWALMGLSATSIGVARAVAAKDEPPSPPGADARPPLSDLAPLKSMLSENGALSVMRLQMFAWTVVSAGLFVFYVWSNGALWDVPTNLLVLMGVSHGGYLIDKVAAK